MPPNGRCPLSEGHLDSSFIEKTKVPLRKFCQSLPRQLLVLRRSRDSVHTQTIRRRSRDRHITTGGDIRTRCLSWLEVSRQKQKKRPAQHRHWSLVRPSWLRLRSIRANSPSPNPNACATRRT